jgi:hypothetical protein
MLSLAFNSSDDFRVLKQCLTRQRGLSSHRHAFLTTAQHDPVPVELPDFSFSVGVMRFGVSSLCAADGSRNVLE